MKAASPAPAGTRRRATRRGRSASGAFGTTRTPSAVRPRTAAAADARRRPGRQRARTEDLAPQRSQQLDEPALLAAEARATDALRAGVSGPADGRRGGDERLEGVAALPLAHGFATPLSGHLDEPVGDRDPEDVFRVLTGLLLSRVPGATNPESS